MGRYFAQNPLRRALSAVAITFKIPTSKSDNPKIITVMDFPTYSQRPTGTTVLQIVLGVAVSIAIAHIARTYWRLRHIPGPFWANFTNLQRVAWVNTQRAHEIHQEVHEKYGESVRFGPNMVSLANPEWIPTVYPIRPGFPKASLGLFILFLF